MGEGDPYVLGGRFLCRPCFLAQGSLENFLHFYNPNAQFPTQLLARFMLVIALRSINQGVNETACRIQDDQTSKHQMKQSKGSSLISLSAA